MKTLARLAGVVLVAALTAAPARPADPPITEPQLVELLKVKIPDDVIAKRVAEVGVEFPADDATFKRLEKAGANPTVMAAVKKAAKPAAAGALSLWVKKAYGWENGLHSELAINGKSLGTFTSDTDRDVTGHLKPGWNTFTLKTTPQPGTKDGNQLIFRVGPVHKDKNGRRVMNTVWEFENGTDWKLQGGNYTHQLGPGVKEVTLTFKAYYAGLQKEGRPLGAGDYVLSGGPAYGWGSPVTATVWVNGHEVNTFLGVKRELVITPYLHKGENTIKVVSTRVKDVVEGNNVKCWVGGPAEYNVTRGKYELTPVVEFDAMHGWKRDSKTGQLVNQVKAGQETVEREIKFTLDHEPGKR